MLGGAFPSRSPSPIQQALGKRESQLASVGLAFGVRKVCQCALFLRYRPSAARRVLILDLKNTVLGSSANCIWFGQ